MKALNASRRPGRPSLYRRLRRCCVLYQAKNTCVPPRLLTPGPPRPSPLPMYPLSILLPQLEGFGVSASALDSAASGANLGFSDDLVRTSEYMTHPVFNTHHSEVSAYIERTVKNTRAVRVECR